jgi:hypothetical protein
VIPFGRAALVVVLAALALLGAVASADASGPVANGAATCAPPKYPGNGYFTSLQVTGLSCASGTKVVKAHYKCRTRGGIRGRCNTTVLGYRCSEVRESIPTEFDAKVTCKSGTKRVIYTYQQNT